MRFVLAFLLAIVAGPCFAQVTPGTTPLSIAKGGTGAGTAAAAWANIVQPPSPSTLGGIKSLTCSASNWFNTLSTAGALGCSQPNFTDLAGSLGLSQIPASFITNAKLATMGAYTFKCNNTGSSAVPADCDVTAFAAKPSPVSADIVLIQDSAASNAYKKTTVGALASAGTVADVNGLTGSVVVPIQPGGRLTLTLSTPAPSTDVVAATTIYYAPMNGSYVPIYNGTNVRQYQFTASDADTVGLSATLGSAWSATTNFDWFITLNGGVPVLCSNAWASDTARTVALALFRGMQTNATTMTSACRINNTTQITVAANQGTYIGTSRTNAAGQMDDSCVHRWLWNAYNQVQRNLCQVAETTANWPYTLTTWRQARGSSTNQIDTVIGLTGNLLDVRVAATGDTSAAGSFVAVGIGINSTTVNSATLQQTTNCANCRAPITANWQGFPAIGRQVFVWLEAAGVASGTNTYYGQNISNSINYQQAGISGVQLM